MTRNCHLCGLPIEGARAFVTFHGFEKLRLNGVTFNVHAGCLRFEVPDRGITLPPRVSDPVAEPDLTYVHQEAADWFAHCREHGDVAQKSTRDDAEMAAAFHLGRRHWEVPA